MRMANIHKLIRYQKQFLLDWISCTGSKNNLAQNASHIKLCTLDNPGWHLTVDFPQEIIESKPFEIIDWDQGEENWMYCSIENGSFLGAAGPKHLVSLVSVLFYWLEKDQTVWPINTKDTFQEPILDRFENWFIAHCDGNWEHSSGFYAKYDRKINNWYLQISTLGSEHNFEFLKQQKLSLSKDEWWEYHVDNSYSQNFTANCSCSCFKEILTLFQKRVKI